MAKRYSLDRKDLKDIAKVAVYSGVSAGLAVIISALSEIDVPTQYALLIPILNTSLVALKDILTDRANNI